MQMLIQSSEGSLALALGFGSSFSFSFGWPQKAATPPIFSGISGDQFAGRSQLKPWERRQQVKLRPLLCSCSKHNRCFCAESVAHAPGQQLAVARRAPIAHWGRRSTCRAGLRFNSLAKRRSHRLSFSSHSTCLPAGP